MSAEHLIFVTSALISPLAVCFTSLIRHGFMPSCFREYILIPVPKKNKDITSSSSYRPIALASSISKILEHLILTKFSSYLHTCPLHLLLLQIVLPRLIPLLQYCTPWFFLSSVFCPLFIIFLSSFCFISIFTFVYSFTDYNNVYGAYHLIDYLYSDLYFAYMIRRIQHFYGGYSPCEDLISYRP